VNFTVTKQNIFLELLRLVETKLSCLDIEHKTVMFRYRNKTNKHDPDQETQSDRYLFHVDQVSQLGGVPMMIRAADMCNTIPDEKVVLTYVSYLCARLLDVREEDRAARTIQIAWRRHHLHKEKAKVKVLSSIQAYLMRP
jgi:hypothetical protein